MKVKPPMNLPVGKLHNDASGEAVVLQELGVIGRSRESASPRSGPAGVAPPSDDPPSGPRAL